MRKTIKNLLIILLVGNSLFGYSQQTFTVTKTTDEDPFITQDVVDGVDTDPVHIALVEGTLQWAIRKANKDIGDDIIEFQISGTGIFQISGTGINVINTQYEFPAITDKVLIDGTSQLGYVKDYPKIIIDGGNNILNGFRIIDGGGSEIKGLYIRNFVQQGVWIGNNTRVIDNIINQIGLTNTVNAGDGIRYFGDNNTIQGNAIGTDFQLSNNLGIKSTGILCWGGAQNSKIGGVNLGEGNIIINCQFVGINVQDNGTDFNLISRNIIYNNANKAINVLFGNQNKSKPIISTISTVGYVTGTAQAGDFVEIFGSTGSQNANEYLITVTADGLGNWSANIGVLPWSHITATATDALNNTSELSIEKSYPVITCPTTVDFTFEGTCINEPTAFTVNTTEDLSNSTLTWDFGDGTSGTGIDPNHTYTSYGTKTVTLTITGPTGCPPLEITQIVNIERLSNTNFSSSSITGCVNSLIGFSKSASEPIPDPRDPLPQPPLQPISELWDYGDEITSTDGGGHIYTEPGTYTVTVFYTYGNGCTRTITTTVIISDSGNCAECPTTNFTFSSSNCIDQPVDFSAGNILLPANGTDWSLVTFTYEWDFGDSNTGTGINTSHTYTAIGTYTVTLTLVASNGCTSEVQHTVDIINQDDITIQGIGIGEGVCTNEEDLVVNGNFNDGYTGFNSGLSLVTGFPNQGEYLLTDDATTLSNYQGVLQFDHTNPEISKFLMAGIESYDNSGTQILNEVWKQTYTVVPNTNYNLALWFTANQLRANNLSILIEIAGQTVAVKKVFTETDFGSTVDYIDWKEGKLMWNSGNNSSAEIKIIFISTEKSYDPAILIPASVIGIDDISFTRCLSEKEYCSDEPLDFTILTNDKIGGLLTTWDFGDNTTGTGLMTIHNYSEPGTYIVTLTIHAGTSEVTGLSLCNDIIITETIIIIDCIDPCEHCIGSFAPLKGEKYVLSAWVKEKNPTNPSEQFKTYTAPQIILNFPTASTTTLGPFVAKGQVIDGWQRIEEVFTIPLTASEIVVKLNNNDPNNEVFFDDIRIHPFDANMKSFVYDPITLRLVAELDENNYATFYEYDEEGKLVRVKKETERGIKTIQESREHTVK